MIRIYSILLAALVTVLPAVAQERFGETVEFSSTIHDFGDIMLTDGPVGCDFTLKNISNKPIAIYNVISSCGCTDVNWTREPIPAGGTGKISATYSNDEGGYPFDKTLTAYVSGLKQPVILKLRGISHAKKLPLSELFPMKFGNIGFREVDIKAGNMQQGQMKSGEFQVANTGGKPVSLSFGNVSPNLKITVKPSEIPAGGTAVVSYTISSDRNLWGKNYYYATPLVDGKSYRATGTASVTNRASGAEALQADPNPEIGIGQSRIGIWSITKEDFSDWSKERKAAGANPSFESSTFSFNKVKAGTKINASFVLTNTGKEDLIIYKIDSDSMKASAEKTNSVAPGGKGQIKVTLDTEGMPAGEVLVLLTLTTNSPLRPLVNLYITGFIN